MKINGALVKETVAIADFIGKHIQLKQAGKNLKGLCPFHNEKTPSFTVNTERGRFHCFGCGESGDVIDFAAKFFKMDKVEAVSMLERETGKTFIIRDKEYEQKVAMVKKVHEMNAIAAKYFSESLFKTTGGAAALAYLRNRSVSLDTIKAFAIGYAPAEWDRLFRILTQKDIDRKLIEQSGLVSVSAGGIRDFFRNRLIFPIVTAHGDCIGFGGRAMDDNPPKYLNTSESPVFSKRRNLFGIEKARAVALEKKEVFITEGYMDCVMMWQAGYHNTVATLGTAITEEQVKMLKSVVERFILIYDGDDAGMKAAVRATEIFLNQSVSARIAMVATGEDPASLISAGRKAELDAAILESKTTVDFLINYYKMKHSLQSGDGLRAFLHGLKWHISRIDNAIEREVLLSELSRELALPRERVETMMGESLSSTQTVKTVDNQAVDEAANIIVGYVLSNPSLKYLVDDEVRSELAPLYKEVIDGMDDENSMSEAALALYSRILTRDEYDPDEVERAFTDALFSLRRRFMKRKKDEISQFISDAEAKGDMVAVLDWMKQKKVLSERENNLKRSVAPHGQEKPKG